MIVIYTDGLAEPNPGLGTYGFSIYRDGERIARKHGKAGDMVTSNFAEYTGLVLALKEISVHKDEEILVNSDSKLLVNQMNGDWKFKKGGYVEKLVEARKLASMFSRMEFKWIPREENSEADELSRIAYAEARSG